MDTARSLIGTKEIPGSANSPTIMGWIKRLGAKVLGTVVKDDATAWCGTFAAHCVASVGLTPPPIAVRAKAWATWGANLRADRLVYGAVLVFEREGGGHVGFYIGEDKDAYHVLGGNQGDAVSVTRILKSRCIARRWPRDVAVIGAPIWISDVKPNISRNEG